MFLKTFIIIATLFSPSGKSAPAGELSIDVPTPPLELPGEVAAELDALLLEEPSQPMTPASTEEPQALGLIGSAIDPVKDATHRVTADDIVGKVQTFYKETQHLTAKFRQTYTNTTFGKTTVSDGRVWIKKPGKMRWDYKGKKLAVEKSFISDGAMLWAIEHNNRQYFKKDLNQDLLPVAVTFLTGKGDLRRDFTAALDSSGKYGTKSDQVLKLTPRKPSAQYKTLYLVVDSGNYRVKQSIVVESSGNTNDFRFYEPNTTAEVKDSYFFFNEKLFKGKYRLANPEEKEQKAK